MKNKEKRLIENMKMISVELTDKQVSQFIKFYEMLVEWNKVMNLTGITEYDEVVMKHFVDSLSIVKVNGFSSFLNCSTCFFWRLIYPSYLIDIFTCSETSSDKSFGNSGLASSIVAST